MPPTLNELIQDRSIQQAILLQRFKNQLVNEVISMLNEQVYPDMLDRLQRRLDKIEAIGRDLGPATTKRLQDMVALVRESIQTNSGPIRDYIRQQLRSLAKVEASRQTMMLSRLTAKANIEFQLPSATMLNQLVANQPFTGAYTTEWLRGLEKSQATGVIRAVRSGVVQGQTTGEIMQSIRGTRAMNYTDGVLQIGRNSTERFVRTATEGVAMAAREAVYKENSDLIDGVQWVATLDTSTCLECGDLDGQVFGVGEGPRPPDPHPNCRCTTVPVIKSWEDLGIDAKEIPESTRVAMDGQVPESQDYNAWLSKQSPEVQDEALGPTRAALFRDGGLDVGDFVDAKGNTLTLDELHAHEKQAFDEAGLTPPKGSEPAKPPPPPSYQDNTLLDQQSSDEWTGNGDLINRALQGDLKAGETFNGVNVTATMVRSYDTLAADLQDKALAGEINNEGDSFFRGEAFANEKALKSRFSEGETFTTGQLTSISGIPDVAEEYANTLVEQGSGKRVKAIIEINSPTGKLSGLAITDGGQPTGEFVLPRGLQFNVEKLTKDADGVWHVELTPKTVSGEVLPDWGPKSASGRAGRWAMREVEAAARAAGKSEEEIALLKEEARSRAIEAYLKDPTQSATGLGRQVGRDLLKEKGIEPVGGVKAGPPKKPRTPVSPTPPVPPPPTPAPPPPTPLPPEQPKPSGIEPRFGMDARLSRIANGEYTPEPGTKYDGLEPRLITRAEKSFREGWDRIPPEIQARLKNVSVTLLNDAGDTNVLGYYRPSQNSISLGVRVQSQFGQRTMYYRAALLDETTIHEYGHALDYSLGGMSMSRRGGVDFYRAWRQDVDVMGGVRSKAARSRGWATFYATTNEKEGFAQLFMAELSPGSSDARALLRNYPRARAEMVKILTNLTGSPWKEWLE